MLKSIRKQINWRGGTIRLLAAAVCAGAVGVGIGAASLVAQTTTPNPTTSAEKQNLACCVVVWGCALDGGCDPGGPPSAFSPGVSTEFLPSGPFPTCQSEQGVPNGTPGPCSLFGPWVPCATQLIFHNDTCSGEPATTGIIYEEQCGGTPWCD